MIERLGGVSQASRETGVGAATIRKYVQLLDLAPELQEQLAAGEVKNTDALASLARQVTDPSKQTAVWAQIRGFTQEVQKQIIQRVDPDLGNLRGLVDDAAEGAFDYHIVRNCPTDCPTIPEQIRPQVAALIVQAIGAAEPPKGSLN